jgi:hypothetical protein
VKPSAQLQKQADSWSTLLARPLLADQMITSQSALGALASLERALTLVASRPLSELEQQGLIQAFEFTHE